MIIVNIMKKKNLILFFCVVIAFLLFPSSYANNPDKWKIGKNTINSSTFELRAGQSAIYVGNSNGGDFKNFNIKVRVTHSEGAKASLWFHSDAKLSKKGYSILIGNPADDRRRSGSLASVRNLYKPVSSSFDLEIKAVTKVPSAK